MIGQKQGYEEEQQRRPLASPAQIEGCEDTASLVLWYREAGELIEMLKAQVYGFREAGIADPDWLHRVGKKLGYCRMCEQLCARRMRVLGIEVPYLPSDGRKIELQRNQVVIARLKQQLRAHGIEPGIEREDSVDAAG